MLRLPRGLVAIAPALVGLWVACGSSPIAPGTLVESSLPRNANPQVSDADRGSQTDGNAAFAFESYRRLAARPGNVIFSPISISTALAMTWAGARGTTEQQMADALQFRLPQEQLHPFFNALDLALNSRGQGARGKDGKEFRLRIVNSIWCDSGYTFLPSFLDVLAGSYAAGVHVLDFSSRAAAADAINEWIAQQTENRIAKLLSADSLPNPTALVLTNAVYLNAAWQHTFEKSQTSDDDFTLRDGTKVRVSMMRQSETFRTASLALTRCGSGTRCGGGSGYRAIELPYDGDQLAMLILLPDTGALDALEASLSPELLKTAVGALASQRVALEMPRWTYHSPSVALKDTLTAMGMKDAFNPDQADFSGMDGSRRLFVGDVVHQAFVAVDEAGTEAAAATGVTIGVTAMPPPAVSFVVDRPFLYLIRDVPTGAILFMGRVDDPR